MEATVWATSSAWSHGGARRVEIGSRLSRAAARDVSLHDQLPARSTAVRCDIFNFQAGRRNTAATGSIAIAGGRRWCGAKRTISDRMEEDGHAR
jgi:ribonuclease PH